MQLTQCSRHATHLPRLLRTLPRLRWPELRLLLTERAHRSTRRLLQRMSLQVCTFSSIMQRLAQFCIIFVVLPRTNRSRDAGAKKTALLRIKKRVVETKCIRVAKLLVLQILFLRIRSRLRSLKTWKSQRKTQRVHLKLRQVGRFRRLHICGAGSIRDVQRSTSGMPNVSLSTGTVGQGQRKVKLMGLLWKLLPNASHSWVAVEDHVIFFNT